MSGDESILVPPRPGIAVYQNAAGNVVFRKQGFHGQPDQCIELTSEEMELCRCALTRIGDGKTDDD